MEVTDVSQLVSWIESGTVSIICDPTQLEEPSAEVNGTVLAPEESTSPTSILSQGFDGPLIAREGDGEGETDVIAAPCSVDEDVEGNEFSGLHHVKEKKQDSQQKQVSQEGSEPQLQLPVHLPEGHYFIQTADGQIIQVVGSLDHEEEKDALPGVSLAEGVEEPSDHLKSDEDGVQILVVGGNSGEDLYLIGAPEKDVEDGVGRNSIPESSEEVRNDVLLLDAEEASLLHPHSQIIPSLPPDIDSEAVSLPISKVGDDSFEKKILKESIQNENETLESKLQQSKEKEKLSQLSVESQSCNKDLVIDSVPVSKQSYQTTSKTKPKLSFKIPSSSIVEGTLVKTDKGEMVAYNLSSLPNRKQASRQQSTLQSVTEMFGPAMKVLRPLEPKKDPKSQAVCKRFSLFSCSDCSAVLHSERSLQNHQRRYHRDWEEECFICGKKFLNVQYVRTHIQETHSKEKSFQCRLCPYKCLAVKELLRHHRAHKPSRVCQYCGRKYITLKLYKKHVVTCREKRKSMTKSACGNLSSSKKKLMKREPKNQLEDVDGTPDVTCEKQEQRSESTDSCIKGRDSDGDVSALSTSPNRRKFTKTSLEQENVKLDGEFKFESKYYHKQAKKMALEQTNLPTQRRSRTGRDRTHRCYLCFKLFSTATALEAHKESYHLVKSERPVRVKTDTALDEREEEHVDIININDDALFSEVTEQVVVKEEPLDVCEEFENVTIIVDESGDSTHVIKPLCIACKAHTSTDYRKHSKWLSKVPDDHQSDSLKRFEQFFPCSIDPASLLQPWLLCKKCVILIDKIADMEEKLTSMKSDLLSRVRGSNDNSRTDDASVVSSKVVTDGLSCETLHTNSPTKSIIKGLQKNLYDIEAYMKDTCEIMEITKPQKGPGRPRKHSKEKLTPVLVGDGGECASEIARFISHGLVKKEQKSINANTSTLPAGSFRRDEVKETSESTNSSDIDLNNAAGIKEEPLQHEFDAEATNSGSPPWEKMALNNHSDQFDDDSIESGKGINLNSQQFSSDLIFRNLGEGSEAESHNQDLKSNMARLLEACDSKSQIHYQGSDSFSSDLPVAPHGEALDLNLAGNVKSCDTPEEFESSDNERELIQDGLEKLMNEAEGSCTGNEEQCERLAAISPSTEERQLDQQKPSKSPSKPESVFMGKKRAELREKRSKMCYKVDEILTKPWRCSECHKAFSSERGACDHYAASHMGENYACEHCNVSYVRKRDLIGHYNKMHFNIKPYKCKLNECPETFSSHGGLYRHMQSAHSVKKDNTKYSCHICCATFAEKRYRDAHLPVCLSKSSDSVPHKCPFCHKAFKLARYLQIHMKTVHWLKDEQFYCEICDKVLTDKKNLIIHMKSHLGETKVKCNICGKEFNRKSYLMIHMRTHTNLRPYKCNVCNKAFNQNSTWKNHERTHTGEKPYKCIICSANFATSSSLSRHVQYGHYNIRDYACDICKKTFISKAKLEEHLKVHTGEKPFKCHVCNRAFNKKNNLRTHMYVHSANKKYKCELCGEGFMRKSIIENHILEQHKLELVLNSDNTSDSADKGTEVTLSTSQFISINGTEDVTAEDSYIVVYADEGEELNDPGEMQVTVLAEDGTSTQIGITTTQGPTSSHCSAPINSVVESSSNVLSEVILDGDITGRTSETLTTLISNGITPAITIPRSGASTVSQVMEMDEVSFKLVAPEDAAVPIYPE